MPGKLQYGNGLKAFAIHLIISQMLALNRVQQQISAMIGAVISEATQAYCRISSYLQAMAPY